MISRYLSHEGSFWTPWAHRGRSGGAPEAFRGHSGSARGGLEEAPGRLLESPGPFLAALSAKYRPGSENGDVLEIDDPYSTSAMFLRSQGLQNEVQMVLVYPYIPLWLLMAP